MPGRPINVISLKQKFDDLMHSFMVVSFPEYTIVLQVSSDKITQNTTSGFIGTEQTLHAGLLQTDVLLQVTPKTLLQIPSNGNRSKWESPKRILQACSNSR
jgi:hypothetical protein